MNWRVNIEFHFYDKCRQSFYSYAVFSLKRLGESLKQNNEFFRTELSRCRAWIFSTLSDFKNGYQNEFGYNNERIWWSRNRVSYEIDLKSPLNSRVYSESVGVKNHIYVVVKIFFSFELFNEVSQPLWNMNHFEFTVY